MRSAQKLMDAEANGTMVSHRADKLFPAPVAEAVESAFKAGGPIWNLVDKLGWTPHHRRCISFKAGTAQERGYYRNRVLSQYIYKYPTSIKRIS